MLAEAIAVIRQLWEGGYQSFDGAYYTVENARIYTLPEELPPIIVAAAGPSAARLAAEAGDGMWCVSPDEEVLQAYAEAGGSGPKYGQVTVCWAATEDEAKKTAYEWWPNAGIGGELSQELPLPRHFEQAAQLVTPDSLAEKLPLGPDPARHAGLDGEVHLGQPLPNRLELLVRRAAHADPRVDRLLGLALDLLARQTRLAGKITTHLGDLPYE